MQTRRKRVQTFSPLSFLLVICKKINTRSTAQGIMDMFSAQTDRIIEFDFLDTLIKSLINYVESFQLLLDKDSLKVIGQQYSDALLESSAFRKLVSSFTRRTYVERILSEHDPLYGLFDKDLCREIPFAGELITFYSFLLTTRKMCADNRPKYLAQTGFGSKKRKKTEEERTSCSSSSSSKDTCGHQASKKRQKKSP